MDTAVHPGRVHVVRVSKTGSTSVKTMTRDYDRLNPHARPLIFNSHRTGMPAILASNPDDQVMFFLRDPVTRFVSGYNSRLREGHGNNPHTSEEKLAFSWFPTPNDVAEALSSSNSLVQDRARAAIASMMHTSTHYSHWVGDPEYLDRRLDKIAFVGMQESFDDDIRRFFTSLGWTSSLQVHARHQAPPTAATAVSELADRNLRIMYADDLALVEWAHMRRSRWADGATLIPELTELERSGSSMSEREAEATRRRDRRLRRQAKKTAAAAGPVDSAAP